MRARRRSRKCLTTSRQKLDRLLDRALEHAGAQVRHEADSEHRRLLKKLHPKTKPTKRHLSQLRFTEQHWWLEKKYSQKCVMTIEEEKAAMWYEAARRRCEVQQAWLDGKSNLRDNGWQEFTMWVVINLPRPWPALDPETKKSMIEASYSPLAVPPAGYSTFPETDKAEQRKVSMQVLRLPPKNDPTEAQRFVERARRFVDAGFLIVALDKKQNQAVWAAFEAIETLPPTFRKADIKPVMCHHLPPGISKAERAAVEKKGKLGTLTDRDIARLCRRYDKPTSDLFEPWHKTAEVREYVLHKRRRQAKLIQKNQFSFERISRQLEAFDDGMISDFVNAVRL